MMVFSSSHCDENLCIFATLYLAEFDKEVSMSQLVRRQVKPLISSDQGEARLRVLSLYKAWRRHIPIMCKDFDIPRTEAQCQAALRREFLKNARVRDVRVVDMLVVKGQQDLQEVVNHWKQVTHIMAKWFPEDNVEEKPKDFISKFLTGLE